MLVRTVGTTCVFTLDRKNSGASVSTIHAIRLGTDKGGKLIDAFAIADQEQKVESREVKLNPGFYEVETWVDVIEAVSGKFDYVFKVDDQPTIFDHGNVNTSPARDAMRYTAKFYLNVEGDAA